MSNKIIIFEVTKECRRILPGEFYINSSKSITQHMGEKSTYNKHIVVKKIRDDLNIEITKFLESQINGNEIIGHK